VVPSKPTQSFRPTKLNVFPVKRRESNDRTTGRPKVVYRLRVEVDGWQWQRTFDRKGHADARAQRISDKHAHGCGSSRAPWT